MATPKADPFLLENKCCSARNRRDHTQAANQRDRLSQAKSARKQAVMNVASIGNINTPTVSFRRKMAIEESKIGLIPLPAVRPKR